MFVVCSGLGHVQRGFERVARSTFEALAPAPELDLWLLNAWGRPHGRERLAPALRRGHAAARLLGRALGRDDYHAEGLSYAASLVPHLALRRPDVVFFSDWPLAGPLGKFRNVARLDYKLLLSNGAPGPPPYHWAIDHVQQLTPELMRIALAAGESPARHTLLPLGVDVPATLDRLDAQERAGLRHRLGLPAHRRVVLSVAALNNWSKRLVYLIDELASLPDGERPFLAMIGNHEAETPIVLAHAAKRLGAGDYVATTVAPGAVPDWYRAADVFALASTTEGFGLVMLEALARGLPCVGHDYPINRFLLGDVGHLADLLKPGSLAGVLARMGEDDVSDAAARRRHAWARDNFGWDALRPRYVEMLMRCAEAS